MFSSRRPALGARAVSDMAPLSATPFDPLAGTRAIVGGHNVVAGSQLSKGGRAPDSPFLPLPPAPSAEEMQRLIDGMQNASTPRSNTPCKSAQAANARSSMMVRSYSMPVPTEKEFALQRSMHTMQRQSQSSWANGWTPSSGSITEARRESAPSERAFAMERTSSKASTSMAMASPPSSPSRKRRSSSGSSHAQRQTYKLSRSPPAPLSSSPLKLAQLSHSPRLLHSSNKHNQENCPPASPYAKAALLPHFEDEQESYFSYRKPSSDHDDMSDDEALTPRAGSPVMLSASRQAKCNVDVDMTFDDVFQGIHPDHLAPPRAMLCA